MDAVMVKCPETGHDIPTGSGISSIKAIISMRVSQVTSPESPESVGLTYIGHATSTEIGSLPNSSIVDIILDASCARNLGMQLILAANQPPCQPKLRLSVPSF